MAGGIQTFDPEVYAKITTVVAEVSEGSIEKLPAALDKMAEQAKSAGLVRDLKNIEQLKEGSDQLIKATKQLLEMFEKYQALARMYFEHEDIDY